MKIRLSTIFIFFGFTFLLFFNTNCIDPPNNLQQNDRNEELLGAVGGEGVPSEMEHVNFPEELLGAVGGQDVSKERTLVLELSDDYIKQSPKIFDDIRITIIPQKRATVISWNKFFYFKLPSNDLFIHSIYLDCLYNRQLHIRVYFHHYLYFSKNELEMFSINKIVQFPPNYKFPKWMDRSGNSFIVNLNKSLPYIDIDLTEKELHKSFIRNTLTSWKYNFFEDGQSCIVKSVSYGDRKIDINLGNNIQIILTPADYMKFTIIIKVDGGPHTTQETKTKWYISVDNISQVPEWIINASSLISSMVFNSPLPKIVDLSSENLENIQVAPYQKKLQLHLRYGKKSKYIKAVKWDGYYTYELSRRVKLLSIWLTPLGNNEVMFIFEGFDYLLDRMVVINSSIVTFPDNYDPPLWILRIHPLFFEYTRNIVETKNLNFSLDELPRQIYYYQGFQTIHFTIKKDDINNFRIKKLVFLDGVNSYKVPKEHIISKILISASFKTLVTTIYYTSFNDTDKTNSMIFQTDLSPDFKPPKWLRELDAFMECLETQEQVLSLQLDSDDLPPEIIVNNGEVGIKLQLDYARAANMTIDSVSFGKKVKFIVPEDSMINAI